MSCIGFDGEYEVCFAGPICQQLKNPEILGFYFLLAIPSTPTSHPPPSSHLPLTSSPFQTTLYHQGRKRKSAHLPSRPISPETLTRSRPETRDENGGMSSLSWVFAVLGVSCADLRSCFGLTCAVLIGAVAWLLAD